ncbi:MAG: lipoate--protein ligase family protein [Armatimonadota bacterium]|nr:lipoate--protein ligase family protein [Armatimonadota bacterium]
MDSTWRLIEHGCGDPYWNMAVDEAIFKSFCAGKSPPTIRFYLWNRPSISLGRFQKPDGSIDTGYCKTNGISIVRRPTGGRAVLHGTDQTFSVVKEHGGASVEESYAGLSRAVTEALTEVGVPVKPFSTASDRLEMVSAANCFDLKARFEVALHGRKIFGCAQLRAEQSVLQQNSLILEAPDADNVNAFVGGCPSMSGVCVAHYADRDTITRSICKAIVRNLRVSLHLMDLTDEESELASTLVRCKYSADAWNKNGRRDFVDSELSGVIY